VLLALLVVVDDAEEVSEGAVVDDEEDVLGVFELVVEFDLVLEGGLQDFELVLDHLELPLLAALGLVDALHAEQLPVVPALHQEDLRVGPFPQLLHHLELLQPHRLVLAVDQVLGVVVEDGEGEGTLDEALEFEGLGLVDLVLVVVELVVLAEEEVEEVALGSEGD